jgi:hypothetical protein
LFCLRLYTYNSRSGPSTFILFLTFFQKQKSCPPLLRPLSSHASPTRMSFQYPLPDQRVSIFPSIRLIFLRWSGQGGWYGQGM